MSEDRPGYTRQFLNLTTEFWAQSYLIFIVCVGLLIYGCFILWEYMPHRPEPNISIQAITINGKRYQLVEDNQ